jgi:hypothetical protein
MYHLTCECGRELIVPRVEGEKTQIVICNCWRKIVIAWPGEYEAKKGKS